MKILFIGDIFGRPGRDAIARYLPELRAELKPDFVIVNADNAAHGTGLIPSLARELYDLGIDLLTGGDHIWDQKEMIAHLDREPLVLRPYNYPPGTPGKGWTELTGQLGQKLVVIHVQGSALMEGRSVDNPFRAMDELLPRITNKHIVVDLHAEATSEKMAFSHYVDGRVSAVLGTHTHVPTADARILKGGTAAISDVGMTGCYDSVIGADKTAPIQKFVTGIRYQRLQPADGEGILSAVLVTLDAKTGRATSIEPVRRGQM
jgi:metallophosphoesterase (TIGR00282 family)